MDYSPFAQSIGAVAFWGFIAAVSVAGIVSGIVIEREKQQTMRKIIESGKEIDPQLLEKLSGAQAVRGAKPEELILGGVMVLAAALGLTAFGLVLGGDDGELRVVMPAIAAMATPIGLALLGYGVWLLRRSKGGPQGG